MSTSPQTKGETMEQVESRTPTPSGGAPAPETRWPSRSMDASFGERLANARNLPPMQAPPPPARPVVETTVGGIRRGFPGATEGHDEGTSGLAPTASELPMSDPACRLPREKGSYRSPYDYPVRGHALGAHNLPPASLTPAPPTLATAAPPPPALLAPPGYLPGLGAPGFVAPVSGSFGFAAHAQVMPRHGIWAAGASNQSRQGHMPSIPETKAVQPAPHAEARTLLLAPLRLMRARCDLEPNLGLLADFIDKHMADELHTVIERDFIIPDVVYLISIPMTEEHWGLYNQVLARFKYPLHLHDMLAGGRPDFDKISGSSDPALRPTLQEGYGMLVYGTTSGLGLEGIYQELVKANFWD